MFVVAELCERELVMTQQEYEEWKSGQYKNALRTCRERFLEPAYGCVWQDAANDIGRVLCHPERIEDSIFSDCAKGAKDE